MSTLLHPEQIKCNIRNGRIKIRMYGDPDEGVSRDFANAVGDCEDELMTGRGWILLKNGMKGNGGLLGNGSQVVRPTENAYVKRITHSIHPPMCWCFPRYSEETVDPRMKQKFEVDENVRKDPKRKMFTCYHLNGQRYTPWVIKVCGGPDGSIDDIPYVVKAEPGDVFMINARILRSIQIEPPWSGATMYIVDHTTDDKADYDNMKYYKVRKERKKKGDKKDTPKTNQESSEEAESSGEEDYYEESRTGVIVEEAEAEEDVESREHDYGEDVGRGNRAYRY